MKNIKFGNPEEIIEKANFNKRQTTISKIGAKK